MTAIRTFVARHPMWSAIIVLLVIVLAVLITQSIMVVESSPPK